MRHHTPATPYSELTGPPGNLRKAGYDRETLAYSSHDTSGPRPADELDGFLAPDGEGGLGRLGPYRVLQLLGRGGMGLVFLAEDTTLHRQVALKVMRPSVAQKPIARQRFLREARATSQIEHDHIVTTYHVGEDRGIPYMAMQLLRGGSLEAWLSQGNRPTVRQAVRIVRETALGLAAAHARGLIHRDVKPSNLWLENRTPDTTSVDDAGRAMMPVRVRVLDFGLARAANENTNLTRIGAIVGTPTYMSPEQARGREIDARSDLFSLGSVLYRLCTGVLPFRGADASAILAAVVQQDPRPVRELNADVPPVLADLIHRMLAKDPARRPTSARAVAEELQTIERDLPSRAPIPEDEPTPALSWQALPKRTRWTIAAAAGGLILVMSLLLVALMPSSGTVVVRATDDVARGSLQKAAVRVVNQRTGEVRRVTLGAQSWRPGHYAIDPSSVPDGLRFEPASFDVSARGAVAVVVHVAQ